MNWLIVWFVFSGICGIVSPYLPLPLPFLFSSISGGACLSRAILAYQEDKKDD